MQIPQPAEDTAGEVTVSGNVGRLAATIDRLRREIHDAQLAAEGRALIALARESWSNGCAAVRPRPPSSWRRSPSRRGSHSWSWPPTSSIRRPRTVSATPPATS
ncbi:hypothetical protein ACFQX6_05110 [Streptosporangium lutulentum]